MNVPELWLFCVSWRLSGSNSWRGATNAVDAVSMRILTVGLAGMKSERSLKDSLRLHAKHWAGTFPLAGQMFIMASAEQEACGLRGKMVLVVRSRRAVHVKDCAACCSDCGVRGLIRACVPTAGREEEVGGTWQF